MSPMYDIPLKRQKLSNTCPNPFPCLKGGGSNLYIKKCLILAL